MRFTILFVSIFCSFLFAIPSFPGAEGWGANSIGGRGGVVVHVTNLNDDGPGSLRAALNSETPKIVVFDVAGVINLDQPVTAHKYTTIAGQTSPGGITLTNGGILSHYGDPEHDVIVRFMRVRGVGMRDSDGDCLRFSGCHDVIIDHCSGSWACDETFDVYNSYNITTQWCVLSEMYTSCVDGSNINRYAFLAGDNGEGRVTLHHTLMSHFTGRTPLMATYGKTTANPSQKAWDLRNCLVYDCVAGGGYFNDDNRIPVNHCANYYKSGNCAGYSSTTPWPNDGTPGTPVYCRKNVIESIPAMSADNMQHWFWETGSVTIWASDSFPVPPVTTTAAAQAYIDVLAAAGCFPRDSADRRFISEVPAKTGCYAYKEDPKDPMGFPTYARPTDTDNDGMPDAWESAHGLNPNNGSDYGTDMNGGYDAIEVYVNELADDLAACSTGRSEGELYAALAGESDLIAAWPNPAGSRLNLALRCHQDWKACGVRVMDIAGRCVADLTPLVSGAAGSTLRTVRWDASRLPAGVYVVSLRTPKWTHRRTIMVVR